MLKIKEHGVSMWMGFAVYDGEEILCCFKLREDAELFVRAKSVSDAVSEMAVIISPKGKKKIIKLAKKSQRSDSDVLHQIKKWEARREKALREIDLGDPGA